MTVTDSKGAFAKDTISYTAINVDPKMLYLNEKMWYNSTDSYFKGHKAFDFQKRDPQLPNVLLIGNSISIGYTPFVRKALAGKCNVYRIPTNGGDTKKCLAEFNKWIGDNNWDIIHFNFGLHDLKRLIDNKLNSKGDHVNSPKEYKKNLEEIVSLLKQKTNAKLIWASTSVVPENAAGRIKGEEIEYNKIAEKIMVKHHIPIDDQFTLTVNFPEDQLPENVHFKASGVKRQGEQAAAIILKILEGGL
ncbi:SGNH/GDSL hydrolase family protein [Flammeovirga pectinis]|uniref:SGNH/GDSL hydrolase family protein n=1 Tax=Flammeovirga pectinis TaxID=2494373 RepID=A0A3S9P6Z3_9BACT|nr:SGNH/GDSL hydrolase family protein [Flammeovirga pectinis]AZQ63979.1 SGNH/GDSL hydrolase family protein [Flammeovirga pectinis]